MHISCESPQSQDLEGQTNTGLLGEAASGEASTIRNETKRARRVPVLLLAAGTDTVIFVGSRHKHCIGSRHKHVPVAGAAAREQLFRWVQHRTRVTLM